MDLVARCIVASFYGIDGPRKDTALVVVLEGGPNPPISLTFDGNKLKDVPSSEVKAAKMVYDALSGLSFDGITSERKHFKRVVSEYSGADFSLYYLHEEGEDSRRLKYSGKPVFILGDQKGLDAKSEEFLRRLGVKRVSLGPYPYLASHCITVVNNELDLYGKQ